VLYLTPPVLSGGFGVSPVDFCFWKAELQAVGRAAKSSVRRFLSSCSKCLPPQSLFASLAQIDPVLNCESVVI